MGVRLPMHPSIGVPPQRRRLLGTAISPTFFGAFSAGVSSASPLTLLGELSGSLLTGKLDLERELQKPRVACEAIANTQQQTNNSPASTTPSTSTDVTDPRTAIFNDVDTRVEWLSCGWRSCCTNEVGFAGNTGVAVPFRSLDQPRSLLPTAAVGAPARRRWIAERHRSQNPCSLPLHPPYLGLLNTHCSDCIRRTHRSTSARPLASPRA